MTLFYLYWKIKLNLSNLSAEKCKNNRLVNRSGERQTNINIANVIAFVYTMFKK